MFTALYNDLKSALGISSTNFELAWDLAKKIQSIEDDFRSNAHSPVVLRLLLREYILELRHKGLAAWYCSRGLDIIDKYLPSLSFKPIGEIKGVQK